MTLSKPVIGLIGGIGSGKSLVAAEFARRGGKVIAGDQFGHDALRQPDIRAQVAERWPQVLGPDGAVDRKKLGAIVFADPAERRALEALTHPYIGRRIAEEVAVAQTDPAYLLIVVDAAILLEAGWDRPCDRIVFVNTPRDVRLRRLHTQRGWTEKEVQAREDAQMHLAEKQSRADAVVDNAGSPAETARQVERLLAEWGIA